MLSIRIVSAAAGAAIALLLATGWATAQTATNEQPGKPLALLAGLRPPHESKVHATASIVHTKTAGRTIKQTAAKRSAAKRPTQLARKKFHEIAAAPSQEQPLAPSVAPANNRPVADAAPRADMATASDMAMAAPQAGLAEAAPLDSGLSAIVVAGETVQVASPDQVNDIDLAADDGNHANLTTAPSERTEVKSMSHVFAAPVHADASAVGSASWVAQVLAALGGAVAAGTVAWFLIGFGPQRMYG